MSSARSRWTRGATPIPLGGPKQRAVLAHLVLRANQLVPAETLVDEIWGEEPPEKARNIIQTYVSHLRKALGHDRIQSHGPGYRLRLDPSELDAARFDALMRDAKKALPVDPNVAVATLEDALALWRGPALADLADQSSLLAEAARLDELRLEAQEDQDRGAAGGRRSGPSDRGVGGPARPTPVEGKPLGPPDAGLLPRGASGRGAELLPASQGDPGGRAGHRSLPGARQASRTGPEAGSRTRSAGRAPSRLPAPGEDRRRTHRGRLPGASSPTSNATWPSRSSTKASPPTRSSSVASTRMPRPSPPWSIRTSPRSTTTGGSPVVPTSSLGTCAGGAFEPSRREGSRWSETGPFASSSRSLWRSRSPTARASRTGTSRSSNILFDPEGNAYLGDFLIGSGPAPEPAEDVRGLARLAGRLLPNETLLRRSSPSGPRSGRGAPEADAFAVAARAALEPTAIVRSSSRRGAEPLQGPPGVHRGRRPRLLRARAAHPAPRHQAGGGGARIPVPCRRRPERGREVIRGPRGTGSGDQARGPGRPGGSFHRRDVPGSTTTPRATRASSPTTNASTADAARLTPVAPPLGAQRGQGGRKPATTPA